MTIQTSTIEDIPEIFRLYKFAVEFQKIKFPENHWPEFEKELVVTEVKEQRQFKLIIDQKIACVWAITYSDPQIWENSDDESSIFIHRIATNPEFRGHNFVKIIVEWAKDLAKAQHKTYIRMDTCGHNERLIAHYQSCGFNFLGLKKLQNTSDLPAHYHDVEVCFFEIEIPILFQ